MIITAAKNAAPVTLTTTAETAVCTTTQPNAALLPLMGISPAKCVCWGILNITAGTGATAIQFRIRAGVGVLGAIIGDVDTLTVTAGANVIGVVAEIDEGVELPGGNYIYTVTAQQVGASGNGTVNDSILCVEPTIFAQ